jgi:hypothetical protein
MLVDVHRQRDDRGALVFPHNFHSGIESIQTRHRKVEDGDVGAVDFRETQRLTTVAGFRHDIEAFALENGPEALADHDVIVGEEQADRHGAYP